LQTFEYAHIPEIIKAFLKTATVGAEKPQGISVVCNSVGKEVLSYKEPRSKFF